ncbi:hypothetical protein VTO73DRAFT_5552 [Trametes versicolor]
MAIPLHSLMDVPCAFAICLLVLLYLRSVISWRARARGRPLPPGPKRLPLVGNLLSIPRFKPWLGFRDLTAQYGEITYLEVLGQSILVLGSPSVIFELLEKRSANSSDRTVSPLIQLAGQGYNFAFMPYGQFWRRHRRAFWQHFHSGVSESYWPIQQAYARDFLVKLLDKPTQLRDLIRYNFSAAAMKVVYDAEIVDEKDDRIEMIDVGFAGLRELTVSVQMLLEFLPVLGHLPDWMPGSGFARTLTRSQAPSDHLVHVEFNTARTNVEQGAKGAFLVSELLARLGQTTQTKEVLEEDELISKNVAAVAVEGGSDTTFSTVEGLFLALSHHPEVQKKAQAELDTVVGPHRLPEFSDRDSLVYVNAIVKEALRWHNVLPLGVGHRTVEDDEFHGYFIPAGTTVIGGVWGCAHDPAIYPDPDTFNPDRFIKDGQLDPSVLDPASLVFGWGRRICPGRFFADAALFITVASLLHTFEITPPLDAYGNPIRIELNASHGFLSYPVDSRCTVKPRSPEAAALLRTSHAQEISEEAV